MLYLLDGQYRIGREERTMHGCLQIMGGKHVQQFIGAVQDTGMQPTHYTIRGHIAFEPHIQLHFTPMNDTGRPMYFSLNQSSEDHGISGKYNGQWFRMPIIRANDDWNHVLARCARVKGQLNDPLRNEKTVRRAARRFTTIILTPEQAYTDLDALVTKLLQP